MIVAANKVDLIPEGSDNLERLRAYVTEKGYEFYEISAATHQGTHRLMQTVAARLRELPPVTVYEPEYVKPLAKELLRDFGSLEALMDAPLSKLIDEHGMGPSSALLIRLVKEMCSKYLEQRARASDVLMTPRQAEDFVRMKIGGGQRETLMTIFLNAHNHIICYDLNPGTVNHASIYVRELAKHAVLCNATGVIIAHNHPSGVCTPSPEDTRLTIAIRTALETFGIKLFDHLIVTPSACQRLNPATC